MEITITYHLQPTCIGSLKHKTTEDNEYKSWCVSYDYEAHITLDVIKAFAINEIGHRAYHDFTSEKQKGFERALEFIWSQGLIKRDNLENNKDFMDFITMYFEYTAIEEYESEEE